MAERGAAATGREADATGSGKHSAAETALPGIIEAVRSSDAAALAGEIEPLEDADVADVIGLLDSELRTPMLQLLAADRRPTVLAELEPSVRDQLLDELPNAEVAEAVKELETDDAVYLLEDMADEDQDEILAALPADERAVLERSLDYPEQSAGRLMQAEFIAVPPFWTVGQTIDHLRETDDLPDRFAEIFVVSEAHHLVGTVPLDRLLRTKRPVAMRDIMEPDPHRLSVRLDQEEVARQFERYNLVSAPVVDADDRLVGVVTADDVVEVMKEEAEEDIYRLGGVGDESVTDTILSITRSRFVWLLVNMATAILASSVISLFDATIEQMVAVAVLMPIVASMGGNAGTQTMTVTVRTLATRELGRANAARIINREVAVGVLNGLLFSVIMGLIVVLWFGSQPLGLVIGAAIVVNLVAAAIAGILIPLALNRIGVDPAVASGPFVTTVTDVVGFFSFLGLATLWLV